jgi:L-glyceraldehyde 3-phosphate reductase
MALAWVLRGGRVTSVVIGASKPGQIDDCVGALKSPEFSPEDLSRIDAVLGG